jgi:DMSO/TMAO reductase YedYZ molybdopterin-dependent catalytic subunit
VQANRAAVVLPPVTGETKGAESPAPPTTSKGAAPGAPAANLVIPPTIPYGADPTVADLTPWVTAAKDFYRVDTAFVLPRVPTDGWTLNVHGMVQHPLTITWADLLAMPQIERWITLACVSNEVGGNLVGNAGWQGVRVADLLMRAAPLPGADCVYSTSSDGFTVTTPLDVLTDGRDALLAIGMNGAPLPIEHGFPVRLVVPGLYGYVSATKWVVDLEVTTFARATAYWTERGWAPRGPIKTSSRIDTPHYGVSLMPGVVAVAGVAWAQHRGISGVQVRVDDGPWQNATLGGAASADAWVQWVFRWDTSTVERGSHHLACRAIDGTGAVQVETPMPPAPDGATGYHSIHVVTR